ncbi:MAG: ATP-binding cassette domain-containing protein [Nibricoccus sp.]
MTPTPAEPAVFACETRGLRKRFGDTKAVDGLDLRVARGQLYAFLGPNGAGKTTSIRMIAGLLRPDGGDIFIEGIPLRENPSAAKRPLAYVPDDPVLYGKLRPLEYLEFVSALWDLPAATSQPRAEELLQTLSLWEKRDDYIESFSRGMKQKMALCAALIHQPTVMLLDEPLTGLDASAARLVKDILLDFVRRGSGLHVLFRRFAETQSGRSAPEAVKAAALRLLQRIDGLHHDVQSVQDRARLLQDEIAARSASRTNRQLYVLSLLTALFLPATFITGLFGINVKGLPWVESEAGAFYVALACVFAAMLTLILLRRRGVIGD